MSHLQLAARGARRLCQLVVGAALTAAPAAAQASKLAPKEVAQIADAAMQAVIPTDSSFGKSVMEHGVRFDFARTLAAFGHAVDEGAPSNLVLRGPVTSGTRALLEDCDQSGAKPCALLGRSNYVFLEPRSISDSEAIVVLHVARAFPITAKANSPARVFLGGFSVDVYLVRSGSGPWRFVRTGGGTKS